MGCFVKRRELVRGEKRKQWEDISKEGDSDDSAEMVFSEFGKQREVSGGGDLLVDSDNWIIVSTLAADGFEQRWKYTQPIDNTSDCEPGSSA